MSTDAATTKTCPFCGAEIAVVALECTECGKRVSGAGTRAEFLRRLLTQELVLRQAMREGSFARYVAGMGGKFRARTIVFAGLSALTGAAQLIALFRSEGGLFGKWDLAVFFAMLACFVVFVLALTDDLLLPGARGRNSPVRGLKAFLQALKLKRYAYAYNCLLPGDRNKRVRRRHAVRVTGTGSGKSTFSDLQGFRGYWQPIFNPISADASMEFSDVKLREKSGDFALVAAKLSAKRKAGGIGGGLLGAALRGLMSQGQEISMVKLLRRIDAQWYLVNGELFSPEDDALEQLSEFSAASDAELVECSKAGTKTVPGGNPRR